MFEIMNGSLKFVLNMVPFRMIDVFTNEKDFNLFDNYEVLNGHSKCDYAIKDPSLMAKGLSHQLSTKTQPSKTVIEEFMDRILDK